MARKKKTGKAKKGKANGSAPAKRAEPVAVVESDSGSDSDPGPAPRKANAFAFLPSDEESDSEPEPAPVAKKSGFAALQDSDSESDEPTPPARSSGFAALASESEPSEDEAPVSPVAPVVKAPTKGKGKGKGKKKGKKQPAAQEEDFDSLLADLEAPAAPKKLSKAALKRQKKKQKQQAAKAQAQGPDLDAVLASLEKDEPQQEKKLTKAQLKRLRKKQKAQAAKAGADSPAPQNDSSTPSGGAQTTEQDDTKLSKTALRKKKKKEKERKAKEEAERKKKEAERKRIFEQGKRQFAQLQKIKPDLEESVYLDAEGVWKLDLIEADITRFIENNKAEGDKLWDELSSLKHAQVPTEEEPFETPQGLWDLEKLTAERDRILAILKKEQDKRDKKKQKKKEAAARKKRGGRQMDAATMALKASLQGGQTGGGGGGRRRGRARKGGKGKGKQNKSGASTPTPSAEEEAAARRAAEEAKAEAERQREKEEAAAAAEAARQAEEKAKADAEALAQIERDLERIRLEAIAAAEADEEPASSPVVNAGGDDWDDEDDWDAEVATPPAPTAVATSAPAASWSDEEEESEEEQVIKPQARKAPKKPRSARVAGFDDDPKKLDQKKGSDKNALLGAYATGEVPEEDVDDRKGKKGKKGKGKKGKRDKKSKKPVQLRSPICCILGHVDTGKTKILDNIRRTNVQDKEAGGITQQIGATFMPVEHIIQRTADLTALFKKPLDFNLPGLLVIDTPGHESFSNLRSRGTALCDIAVLVVDIMHGLEPQTIESLNMLVKAEVPFIVALNKVDRLNVDWEPKNDAPFVTSIKSQSPDSQAQFKKKLDETVLAFAQEGHNAKYYQKMKKSDWADTIALVPTSAHSGEGIPDLLVVLTQLTQKKMSAKLQYLSELECTVLEVKKTAGHGTTLDVILSNGTLQENDTIVCCGMEGPIVSHIRALLTPQPLREMRVKGDFVHHKIVKASMGVKISGPGLEKAVAGAPLYVKGPRDDVEDLKDEVQMPLGKLMAQLNLQGKGVFVAASTLGALEALMVFLGDMKIPVSRIHIGDIHKKQVMEASVMLEWEREFACMLCFNVNINKEAETIAESLGVQIFSAEIIYHLEQNFAKYVEQVKKDRRASAVACFPVVLSILEDACFRQSNPLLLGVKVERGLLKKGTPITAMCTFPNGTKRPIELGSVNDIRDNDVPIDEASIGMEVSVAINSLPGICYGRQFTWRNKLCSKLSRRAIDHLKENFKEDIDKLAKEGWPLVIWLKKYFDIV